MEGGFDKDELRATLTAIAALPPTAAGHLLLASMSLGEAIERIAIATGQTADPNLAAALRKTAAHNREAKRLLVEKLGPKP